MRHPAFPDTPPPGAGFPERVLVPVLLAVLIAGYAVWRGPDAGWDLLNYHVYNPFALLHKAPGTDLVPAQLQSFLPPTLDLLPYLIRARLNAYPALVDALLSIPSIVAALIAFRIGLLLLPPAAAASPWRALPVLATLALGFTGAAGLPVTGTSMGEMPGACFLLAGLWLLLREVGVEAPRPWPVLAAGLLFGIGLGLKLTLAPYGVAAVLGFLVFCRASLPARLLHAVRLGGGTLVGALAVGGYWWLHLLRTTGNPLFPFYNNLFRSPLIRPAAMRDDRFLRQDALQALFYPFHWAFNEVRLVSEYAIRDPRMALAYVLALAVAAVALVGLARGRPVLDRRAGCFLLFLIVAYALWQAQFSILRYLAPIELLSGFLILLAARPLLASTPARPATSAGLAAGVAAGVAALVVGITAYTRYPDWGRARPDGQAASLNREVLPREGMMLLLTSDPMAFVAAFADPGLRVVGVNNNIVRPGWDTMLAKRVENAVRGFDGPLWGLEGGDTSAASIPDVMAFYGLTRTEDCANVTGNLLPAPLRLCRLVRVGRAPNPS